MRLFSKAFVVAAAACAIAATPAHADDWYVAETNNFIIKTYDDEEEIRRFSSELERFDMALRSLQGLPIGTDQPSRATKLTVYRFGDASDIGKLINIPSVAGFYIARAGDSVAYTPAEAERSRTMTVTDPNRRRNQLQRLDEVSVLQHEYVHYFMMQHFPAAYPRWYSEGYAELLATMRFNDDGSYHIGDPPQYRAYQIFQRRPFPLEEMLDAEYELVGIDWLQHYATGWLFTHYLNFVPERRAKLNEYLVAVAEGENSLDAARRIFGDLKAIDRELLKYRNGPFPGLTVRLADYVEPVVSIRPMESAEVAFINAEMRLGRGVDDKEAARLAREISAKIGEFPDNAHALSLLVRAQTEAKDYDAAMATAERLMAVDPTHISGPLYASYVAIERARTDASWLNKVIEFAAQAAAIDRSDPRPAVSYYYGHFAAKAEMPESAIIALEEQYGSAGSDPIYRVMLARQLVLENRLDSARVVLQPIAFRGHNQGDPFEGDEDDGENQPSLDKIMAYINSGNRDDALAMLDDILTPDEEDQA